MSSNFYDLIGYSSKFGFDVLIGKSSKELNLAGLMGYSSNYLAGFIGYSSNELYFIGFIGWSSKELYFAGFIGYSSKLFYLAVLVVYSSLAGFISSKDYNLPGLIG